MSPSLPTLSSETLALLDRERGIPPQPVTVRGRALTRARAALVAGDVTAPPLPAPRIRWAAAVALACVASAAAGAAAAAYGIHARLATAARVHPAEAPTAVIAAPPPASGPSLSPLSSWPDPRASIDDGPAAPSPSPSPPPAPRASRPSRAAAVRAELRLLRQARAAVAWEDFAAALAPIAEHERRFKHGRLSEEREALRVKALIGVGRNADALRAAAAFRTRFPRSVLLPVVDQLSLPQI